MSKLNKKFLSSIFLVFIFVGGVALYLNLNFIERFFLHEEKNEIKQISQKLLLEKGTLKQSISKIEAAEDVVIAWVEYSKDNELLNKRLRDAFYEKGVSLKKYWLWDEDQQETIKEGRKIKIYSQEKLNYSLLVEYLSVNENFIAIGKIIPSIDKTLSLINGVTIGTFIGAGILLFLIVSYLVHKITYPLKKIGETAREISKLKFDTIQIHTNDELEYLANDINLMSSNLQESHQLLQQKNGQMKELLANVSHDLKTPIALIKMYAQGIKDNMDDGTFLDTIIVQNNRMEKMVEGLLNLAKLQQKECQWQMVNISDVLKELLKEYRLEHTKMGVCFLCNIEDCIVVKGNSNGIYILLSNMISNSVKYAKDGNVKIALSKNHNYCEFLIKNSMNDNVTIDIKKLWDPFYVAEESRNKNMSGTGLGLSLVKAISEKYNIDYNCEINQNTITFLFRFHM